MGFHGAILNVYLLPALIQSRPAGSNEIKVNKKSKWFLKSIALTNYRWQPRATGRHSVQHQYLLIPIRVYMAPSIGPDCMAASPWIGINTSGVPRNNSRRTYSHCVARESHFSTTLRIYFIFSHPFYRNVYIAGRAWKIRGILVIFSLEESNVQNTNSDFPMSELIWPQSP